MIYGSTFSGIAAAVNAAKFGHSVALVEEYSHIGGLMTGGLFKWKLKNYYEPEHGPEESFLTGYII